MSYKELKSYQQATIIYDFTVEFCKLYINRTDMTYRSNRMMDQMVQAARSGKQNIVEGSSERTSQKSELKLLGVSRASFQELLEDYEDFLRQHSFPLWRKENTLARAVCALAYKTDKSYRTYKTYLEKPETAANAIICLIHQVNYLLDRQIRSLENKFISEGGYTEKLFAKRLAYRSDRTNKADK